MGARNPRWLLLGLAIFVAGIQFVPVDRSNPPVDHTQTIEANTEMAPEVKAILDRACIDCHSNKTRWPWYSYVAPASWLVADDVEHARDHFNFSEWGAMEPKDADHTLDEICEEIEGGFMPLASYRWMHSEAELSENDVYTLCDWAAEERGRIRRTQEQQEREKASAQQTNNGKPDKD